MGGSEIKRVRFFMLEILNYRLGYIGDATMSEKQGANYVLVGVGCPGRGYPYFILKSNNNFPSKPVLFLPPPNTYHCNKNNLP